MSDEYSLWTEKYRPETFEEVKGQKDIGEGINTIITNLAQANDLKGVIDVADFDDDDKLGKGKDKQDRQE